MNKSKFSPVQVAGILKEFEQGKDVETIPWNMGAAERHSINEGNITEEEKAKLKRMYADLALELNIAKHVIEKKL